MRQHLLNKVKYLILYRNSSEVSDTVQKQQRNIWYYTESAAKYLCKNNSEVLYIVRTERMKESILSFSI